MLLTEQNDSGYCGFIGNLAKENPHMGALLVGILIEIAAHALNFLARLIPKTSVQ